jgi:hypothetical protein
MINTGFSVKRRASSMGASVSVRQPSSFCLPDANVIVPDRNYAALVDLRREDERA